MSMVLEDDSICSGGEADKGLLVNFFNRQVSCLPQVEQVGQIIECRRFKLQSYQNRVQAISTNYCSFSVFAPSANGKGWSVKRSHEKTVEPSEEEIEICNSLLNNNNNNGISTTSTSMLASSRPSLRVEDIKTQNIYFDWVAQVVKGPLEGDKNVETYILTDFTKTPFEAYCRIDSVNLPSSILVPVTFWDNYADEARLDLREGMVVRVENLRSKLVNNSLSFVLHGDPSQIRKITICQEVPSDFERRRMSYIAADPSTEQDIVDIVSCEKPLINKDAFLSQRPTTSYTIKLTKGLGIPSTPIKTILSVGAKELPAKFIVSCRIKETTPSDYASFSHPKCTFCGRVTSVRYNGRDNGGDGKARCTICKRAGFTPTSWGWMFSFLLEDSASTSLPVLFLQEDAEKFLSGLKATDLEEDLESLERLEDIMASLVGSGGGSDGGDQNATTKSHLLCVRAASGAPGGIKYRICNSIVVRQ